MQVNDTTLSWRVGRRAGEVALSDIERVKAVTTLDLSQRATVFTRSGKKLYIPSPCMPPSRTFDAQMINRKVPFHRALF